VGAAFSYGAWSSLATVGLAKGGLMIETETSVQRNALREALWRVTSSSGSPLDALRPFGWADRAFSRMTASADERVALRTLVQMKWHDESALSSEHSISSVGLGGGASVQAVVERRGGLPPLPGPLPGGTGAKGEAAMRLASQGVRVDEPLTLAVRA